MTRPARMLVILALACCSCQRMGRVGTFGQSMVDYFSGNTPIKAVAMMEDRYFADERRQGINRLVSRDFGRRPPYTDRFAQIAQFDSDFLVRATAIRALNRSRDTTATPVYIKALDDQAPLVRQEAAKALGNMPDPAAVTPLIRLVSDPQENRDVRIAAADALRHYRSLEVGRSLAATLGARDFGVAWQSRWSLVAITGRDLRYNEAEWLEHLAKPDHTLN